MLLKKKGLYASAADCDTYHMFAEAGVIGPNNLMKAHGRQTCSQCADGFRLHISETVIKMCKASGGDDLFFHNFKGNGEAMRFVLDSPLSEGFSMHNNTDLWGRIKVLEIDEVLGWAEELGVDVAQHRTVHHWPCKAALSRGITFAQSIDLVVKGKVRLKHQIAGLQVALDLFTDWSEDVCKHDLIKKEAYVAFIRNTPSFHEVYDNWQEYLLAVSRLPVLRVLEIPLQVLEVA